MKTVQIPTEFQHTSPAGAEVRLLMDNEHGGIAHCTLKQGKISRAVKHKTVSEFWHVIGGRGQIWRNCNGLQSVADLSAGITIDIPLGTEFQYRAHPEMDLVFVCVTMPPWSGADEASYVEKGAW